MRKIIVLGLVGMVLAGCNAIPTYQSPESVSYTVEGEISNQAEAEAAVQVIQENLHYATLEDMDGYLSTLIAAAREATEKELSSVFAAYDLEHTILGVEVMEQQPGRMLIRTEQQTVMLDAVEGEKPYRNHIAEANHTLVKEDGSWKIEETIMTDTKFID